MSKRVKADTNTQPEGWKGTTSYNMATRAKEGGRQYKFTAIIDWTDFSLSQYREWASKAIRIKWQEQARKREDAEAFLASLDGKSVTIKAVDIDSIEAAPRISAVLNGQTRLLKELLDKGILSKAQYEEQVELLAVARNKA